MDLYDRIIMKRRQMAAEAHRQLQLALNAKIRDCCHPTVWRRCDRRNEFMLCSSCGLSISIKHYLTEASTHPFTSILRARNIIALYNYNDLREVIKYRTFHVSEMMFEALVRPKTFSYELLSEILEGSPWSVDEVLHADISPHQNQLYETVEQWYAEN